MRGGDPRGGAPRECLPVWLLVTVAEAQVDAVVLSDSADQGAYSAYNSLHFWRLVIQRPLWIMWMLQEGYSVLQCDVDIVFLHNPFPALEAPKMRRFDALFQSEQVYGINCGFYFVRPTNATRRRAVLRPPNASPRQTAARATQGVRVPLADSCKCGSTT